MPYIIKKVKSGYKVCKENDKKVCFSKKGLTENKAKKQKTAIILSELRKQGRIPKKGAGQIFSKKSNKISPRKAPTPAVKPKAPTPAVKPVVEKRKPTLALINLKKEYERGLELVDAFKEDFDEEIKFENPKDEKEYQDNIKRTENAIKNIEKDLAFRKTMLGKIAKKFGKGKK